MTDVDIIVVGAGMAGASVAAMLAPSARVALLEMEAQPGYHTTGRSAATWIEGYGNDTIRKLNRASRPLLEQPPKEFSDTSFMSTRGMLLIENDWTETKASEAAQDEDTVSLISVDRALELVPTLRRDQLRAAAYTDAAFDIDVDALLGAFLRQFRNSGGVLACDSEVTSLVDRDGRWQVTTKGESYTADVVVNAAGAWSAKFGAMAGSQCQTDLTPLRRSAAIIPLPDSIDCTRWPITCAADESFYFKPEAGQLMLSPADETPVEPHDAFAEDLDIAVAVDRFQKSVDVDVTRVGHTWAGLRTFSGDRTPVVGFDPDVDGFFWLCGQGGYGIQTAPAMASLASSLVLARDFSPELEREQIDLAKLDPSRFSQTG